VGGVVVGVVAVVGGACAERVGVMEELASLDGTLWVATAASKIRTIAMTADV
jgi:hypothetical protein